MKTINLTKNLRPTLAACLLTAGFCLQASHSQAGETLVELLMDRQMDAAHAALAAGADPDLPAADNTTALTYAANLGDADLVRSLLAAGADPDARNDYGATPLGEAAYNGNLAIITALVEAGADVNQASDEGETPLMLVARAGNLEATELLLEHGAQIDAREQWGGQTALMWASAQRQTGIMKLLIDSGADVNLQGYPRIWDRRITSETRPKDMNKGGFSALQYAARQGCIECLEILIKAGADLEATDPDRVTALGLALLNFHFDSAAVLIEAGAEINQWDLYGRTPLYNAIDMNAVPDSQRADIPTEDLLSGLDIARILLERGANPNVQLKHRPPFRQVAYDRGSDKMLAIGATPLMVAASVGNAEAARLLLEYGAHVDLPNMYGVTPLMLAAGNNFSFVPTRGRFRTEAETLEVMKVLLDAGADINAISGDPTLRPHGNDIPRPDRYVQESPADRGPDVIEGKNALHGAARHGWLEVARFLIDRGIHQQLVDDSGRTPLDYARGLYPPAFNDSPAEPDTAMIELLTSSCAATDGCVLDPQRQLL